MNVCTAAILDTIWPIGMTCHLDRMNRLSADEEREKMTDSDMNILYLMVCTACGWMVVQDRTGYGTSCILIDYVSRSRVSNQYDFDYLT